MTEKLDCPRRCQFPSRRITRPDGFKLNPNKKSIREHPFGDYELLRLWSFGRRKTLYLPAALPRSLVPIFLRAGGCLFRATNAQDTFNRKSKSLAFLLLLLLLLLCIPSRTTPINSFQTTTDYLAFHRPRQTRIDASQGIIFGCGTANPFPLPRAFSSHQPTDPSDRRFRGSHAVIEGVREPSWAQTRFH